MHRDLAAVEVAIDRQTAARTPGGVLCAANVTLTEPGGGVMGMRGREILTFDTPPPSRRAGARERLHASPA